MKDKQKAKEPGSAKFGLF